MIKIGNQWVAAQYVARIVPHPAAKAVCVIMHDGKEIRAETRDHDWCSRDELAAKFAKQVNEELQQCRPNASP